MSKYVLEKIDMDAGHRSSVRVGAFSYGGIIMLIKEGAIDFVETEDFDDIKIGDQVLVATNVFNLIKTSPITEILESDEDSVVFKTKTSTYEIVRESDEEK